jgi:hypothetical protein
MEDDNMKYALGTEVETRMPWGIIVSAKALCSDGKVRKVCRISSTPDTFFSIPAAVKVKGKTVSGYITTETVEGLSTATDGDPAVVKFRAVEYRKNYNVLPNL